MEDVLRFLIIFIMPLFCVCNCFVCVLLSIIKTVILKTDAVVVWMAVCVLKCASRYKIFQNVDVQIGHICCEQQLGS